MTNDPTFADVSLYGSDRWCAATLGKTYDTFRKVRSDLEADGFPARDRLLRLTVKADVIEWIARRRRLSDAVPAPHHKGADTTKPEIRYDRL